ncbi:M23 family metallopeptidase [Bacteriovorax sp. Seq25_V]|uniref:M23 family metallopeptidase n=1 Tax=Bacteriovorax sp. Seq25_V TaxID=1201288 RepID=UPI000389E0FC|nr:peptidoglycan DD-metalloendopeptidase family protein [Bacteriovorax sp. Seq25_V]EQC43971.1 peptidase, M23 family [Bacteriovorax sp. Seq25_V]
MKIVYLAIILSFVSCSMIRPKKNVVLPTFNVAEHRVFPGKVKKLQIEIPKSINELSNNEIVCGGKKLASVLEGDYLVSYFSLNYKFLETSKEKSIPCFLESSIEGDSYSFHIFNLRPEKFDYPLSYIKVNKKHVDLSKEDLDRFLKEKAKLKDVYSAVTQDKKLYSTSFVRPLKSKVTGVYGSRRVFNNKKDSWHSGTDFRARRPIPITSSNDGVVVFADDLFFNGKTVLVDHGLGILTMYCHLSKINVKVGDKVDKKMTLGLSGNTGRSSAPHLHWGVRIGENWVDGLQFLDEQTSEELKVNYQSAASKK